MMKPTTLLAGLAACLTLCTCDEADDSRDAGPEADASDQDASTDAPEADAADDADGADPDAEPDDGGPDGADADGAGDADLPPVTEGDVYVVAYDGDAGTAHPDSPWPMFWQSSYATIDGTLIEWGTGDHGTTSDNGVREFDPLTGTQSYVYPNNSGTRDESQYDNLHYWYIPRIDSLVIPARGQYDRASGTWPIGDLISGTDVVGSGADNLFEPDPSVVVDWYKASYNMHQAWSRTHDCGVALGGGNGGDSTARAKMWIVVPSSGLGGGPTPYTLYQRDLPAAVDGARPYNLSGRDGACFLEDYVYWVGGGEDLTANPVPHFFRMRITPHLTSTSAPLEIERLPDAPAAFTFGLLRADPHILALLAVTSQGLFVFDVVDESWIVVTPPEYVAEFEGSPTFGLLPSGCMGDFVEARSGQVLRRFYFRPGHNHAWEYDYGGEHNESMHLRFRSIELGRR